MGRKEHESCRGALVETDVDASGTDSSEADLAATQSETLPQQPNFDAETALYLQGMHRVHLSRKDDGALDWTLMCPYVGSEVLDVIHRPCGMSAPCEVCGRNPEYLAEISLNTFDTSKWLMVHGVPHVLYGSDSVPYAAIADECGLHFSMVQGFVSWCEDLCDTRGEGLYLVDVDVKVGDDTQGPIYVGVDAVKVV